MFLFSYYSQDSLAQHDQESVHQLPGALAPAQRQHGLCRAAQAHPDAPAREEAEQERDPAAGHALHQLPGADPGRSDRGRRRWRRRGRRPDHGPVPGRPAQLPAGQHGEPAGLPALGFGQRHGRPLTQLQLRQLRGLVGPPAGERDRDGDREKEVPINTQGPTSFLEVIPQGDLYVTDRMSQGVQRRLGFCAELWTI